MKTSHSEPAARGAPEDAAYRRILVAVDSSNASNRALEEAIRNAKASCAELRIIHVLDDKSISLTANPYAGYHMSQLITQLQQAGAELLAQAGERARAAGVAAETILYEDLGLPVEQRVLEAASTWPADLIVMGTHGRHGLGRAVLGSCAEAVLRTSTVPVLMVRAA